MKTIDLRTGSYFPGGFRVAGAIFVAVGFLLIFVNIYIGLALTIAGVLILTTQYRVAIDTGNRTYHDYVWILGLKSGDRGKFESIQYIFINASKVSETMGGRISQTTIVSDTFDSYLRFSERHKIHLATNRNKGTLVNNMKVIAQQLNCDVIDYTSGIGTRI